MAKKGGGSTAKPSAYESEMANIAKEYYNRTRSLREPVFNQLENVIRGRFDPTESILYQPVFAQAKSGIESQYGQAKENIISNLPEGGSMADALTKVEMGRAEQAGQLPAMISKSILDDMFQKAYGTATIAPQQSMAGLGSAASSLGMRQSASMQSQAAENAAKYGGLGYLGGSALASGGKGGAEAAAGPALMVCWVAEVIFGKDSFETVNARMYCLSHDNWFVRLYSRFGKTWAKFLDKYDCLIPAVKPVWNYMATRGY